MGILLMNSRQSKSARFFFEGSLLDPNDPEAFGALGVPFTDKRS
ncbi:MAG: hypothetical protein Ct9H300mP7_4390 [Verrucomicrobiota bacterium]|nr:MAG: hypothetical protein Ct9H300mP7_4390 [Verrucomicrobiota bacterium]